VSSRHIDTAIFDLGGVIMVNGRHSDLVRRFPREHAEAALRIYLGDYGEDGDHPWHRLERGEISLAECQALNRAALEAAGIPVPELPSNQLPEAGENRRPITFEPSAAMIALVVRLRDAGLRTGILTNNVREFRDAWRTALPYDELFDDIIDSHEVGLRKPNRAIYELALTRLNATAGRTAFLDDVPVNVVAATSLGMFGVVVDEDCTPAIAAVERLAGLA
jgi:putative hydrolase of the HAD superfamily